MLRGLWLWLGLVLVLGLGFGLGFGFGFGFGLARLLDGAALASAVPPYGVAAHLALVIYARYTRNIREL